jgi:hypothetical protein
VFPNVAFLSLVRRIEYMSLFFVAYWGVKDKKALGVVLGVVTITLLGVALYGVGQKYLGFPAFLTMNEEFAKGIPLTLSQLSRVPSTFGGHYDLAAYLVMVIPIVVSVAFGLKHWWGKIFLLSVAALGTVVLFMTVSRISFFALFIALGLVLLFQKKKVVLVALPIILVLGLFSVRFFPSLVERFGSTIKEIDVLVDANTGEAFGHSKQVSNDYFKDKVIKQQFLHDIGNPNASTASPSGTFIIPFEKLPPKVILLTAPNAPTGEDLPQGTGYINLSLSPVTKRLDQFYYELKPRSENDQIVVQVINGDFVIKKALAYDLSFTTRFQGEWPHALTAFERNILVGSGYGSVSLAVDNSYLRMLAEVGGVGFISFLAIFIILIISVKATVPSLDSPVHKSFVLGFVAGIVGLAINALFIDVFEASKVAFVLWLLAGATLGSLRGYQNKKFEIPQAFRKAITSPYAMSLYLLLTTIVLFSPMLKNYFVGDDFTWFRWVADCGPQAVTAQRCQITGDTIWNYFTNAQGFFYRPGAKIYFLLMYSGVWLNQTVYHGVSLALHFLVAVLK